MTHGLSMTGGDAGGEMDLGHMLTNDGLEEEMTKDASYPDPGDPDLQYGLYVKREFYAHRVPIRPAIDDDERMEAYAQYCGPSSGSTPAQALLPKLIHPSTPYRGILVNQGTGVGKTKTAINIAEGFKGQIEKYGTKIVVLVPGPILRQNFIQQIVKFTGETYTGMVKSDEETLDARAREAREEDIITAISQYYHIYTYRGFSKRVLGEKVKEQVADKVGVYRSVARKTKEGEYERELAVDHIDNLDNGLLIIDEAHNVTENDYGRSVSAIINRSKNLRVVLLTATPNKNYADGVIELINFLRPKNSQIERDKVFTAQGYDMAFKPGGEEYFRSMIRGYVSYVRGADPLTFARRVDMGEIPPGLDFTRVIQCFMEPFQQAAYDRVQASATDSFDRDSEAVSNFAMPGLTRDLKSLTSYHGIEGLNTVRRQLVSHRDLLCKLLHEDVMSDAEPVNQIIKLVDKKEISGLIFQRPYLSRFSTKFDRVLSDLEENVRGKLGSRTSFVYSNLVRSGIELFAKVLLANGYLEYRDNRSEYSIEGKTICYLCGQRRDEHSNADHAFGPATYLLVTGGGEDEGTPDEKFNIIHDVFNRSDNQDGRHIKMILGSRVMKEGVSTKNVGSVYLLDVHYTLGRVEQVLGRAIRFCSHSDMMNQDNLYPVVKAYRYVVSLKTGMSSEIEMYSKAEAKFKMITVVDRICAEEAVDCPLMRGVNLFEEELREYEGCGSQDKPCPAICGYQDCYYQCSSRKAVSQLYDPESNMYRKLSKNELDYSTYDREMAKEEIDVAKRAIVALYRRDYVYKLRDLLRLVKATLSEDAADMFDPFYVYQALDDLTPVSANDFNNWSTRIRDKFGRNGYLIHVKGFYLFQPFGQDESLPAYYRRHYVPDITSQISLRDYLQSKGQWKEYKTSGKSGRSRDKRVYEYDFDSTLDYYQTKDEAAYVGVLESPITGSADHKAGKPDQFKIRKKRPRFVQKKRETGVPSFFGSVCNTSKSMKELMDIQRKIGLRVSKDISRGDLCQAVRDRLYALERYGDGSKTWLIVPANHQTLPFPLNIGDRLKRLQSQAKSQGLKLGKSKRVEGEELYPDIKEYSLQVPLVGRPSESMISEYSMKGRGEKWTVTLS